MAPVGFLRAFTLEGGPLWSRRLDSAIRILACLDPIGSVGSRRLLAASQNLSGARLMLFDLETGSTTWVGARGSGGIGSVKVISSNSARTIFWLPAGSDTVTALSWKRGAEVPAEKWSSRLANFVSDPYSSSSLAFDEEASCAKLVVTGGRGQVVTLALDARNGKEIGRTSVPPEAGHGLESGGSQDFLEIARSSAKSYAVTVSDYPSDSTYMFQGVTVTSLSSPIRTRSIDSFPAGYRAPMGAIADFEGLGRLELLASHWDPRSRRHELELRDLADFHVRARLPGFYLLAIVPRRDGNLLLGRSGVVTEVPTENEPMIAVAFRRGKFRRAAFESPGVRLAQPAARFAEARSIDHGVAPPVLSGTREMLLLVFEKSFESPTHENLCLLSLETSRRHGCFSFSPGVTPHLLGVSLRDGRVRRLVAAGNDGTVHFLDGDLREIGGASVGGYYRAGAPNGHSTEAAAAGPLTAPGRNDVVIVDSRNRVLRLSDVTGASPSRPPRLRLIADPHVPQETVLVSRGPAGGAIVIRDLQPAPALFLVDSNGRTLWRLAVGTLGGAPEAGLPVGLNTGTFGGSGPEDIVLSMREKGVSPARTCAIDGVRGVRLWCSPAGAFWDSAPAVGTGKDDAFDDIVFNYNSEKGHVLGGRDGAVVSGPAVLPPYRNLGLVDYNGAPMLIDSGGNGGLRIVNGEDDAHLALLSVGAPSAHTAPRAAIVWSVEQTRLDDQRDSMPAAAPAARGEVLLGTGSRSGVLESRRASDGVLLWRRGLLGGAVSNRDSDNALSSVLAVDLDQTGLAYFVVGGFDGWLYALESATGRLLWTIDLGAPVGDPIAADIDGAGRSVLLVPAANGYLYAIGPAH